MEKNKGTDTGILIFGMGHPYYCRYAHNLALTIKAVENVSIALVHDQVSISHLDETQRAVFDYLIEEELPANCSAKLHSYRLSPFEKTVVLDADMVWLPVHQPEELFTELNGVEFTAITEGSTDNPSSHYFFWAEVQEIREKYKIEGNIHQWRTEVMYFERSEKVQAMFEDAIKIHSDHGLSKIKNFAEGVPDELAINIAAAKYGIEPHKPKWQPSYWPQMHQDMIPEPGTLYREYYLLSAGGNMNTDKTKRMYNNIVKAQAPKIGLSFAFGLQSKHSFLPERRKS